MRGNHRNLFAFLILLGSSIPAAEAAEHRVGTLEELNAAIKAAEPGDQIVLRDGPWRDVDILFEADGSADRPITLRAETPGKVIVSGRSRLRIAGSWLVVAGLLFDGASYPGDLIAFRRDPKKLSDNCRLTDTIIIDCDGPDRAVSTRWVSLYGRDNRVDHCGLEGKTGLGPTLVVWVVDGQEARHRIDHNHFGQRPPLGQNGGETIRVGTSDVSMTAARVVVESNLFEKCDGEAEIISNKSCENIYRDNTFLRCSGALTLRHGNNCVVEGNIFLGWRAKGSGGVRIIGEGHKVINNYFADLEGTNARAAISIMNGIPDSPLAGYFPVKGGLIASNTVIDCRETLVIGLDGGPNATVPPEGCEIANNLFIGDRPPLIDQRARPIAFRWRDNLASGGAARDLPEGVDAAEIKLSPGPHDLLRPSSKISAGCSEDLAPIPHRKVGPSWLAG